MGCKRLHDELSRGWKIHPEMYDRNGNIVPDEIVAFRFENHDNNDEDDDD